MVSRVAHMGVVGVLVLALSAGPGAKAGDDAEAYRTAGLLSAMWAYPTKATLGFGVIATRLPANFECQTPCRFHGVTLQGLAGMAGGELAVGYGSLVGETANGRWLLRRVFVGYGVRAAVLRTWGESTLDPDGATFAGVEGAVTITQFGLKLGVFHRIESVAGRSAWRIFGGAGWGF